MTGLTLMTATLTSALTTLSATFLIASSAYGESATALKGSKTAVTATAQAGQTENKATSKLKDKDKPKTPTTTSTASKTIKTGARTVSATQGTPYSQREEVMQQALDLAQRRDLDPQWVRQAIGQARHLPSVARLMMPPPSGTPKNWRLYRSRFVEPVRIAAGARFWQANREWLERAEASYGVPAAIIVGIIGVETLYGQQMGSFRVIDALATLAFDFPKAHPRAEARQAFFLAELEQFLSLSSRTSSDPLMARGSYAGAMGMPQFMPSSWVRHAVDFDGDGKVDLFNSAADAIGSVANYLKTYNWQPGLMTHHAVRFDADRLDLDALLAPDILPTFSPASMAAKGALVTLPTEGHSGPLALVELQNGADPAQYVAGTENFYAITRYNWSSYYAMAVIELAEAVAREVRN